MQAGFRHLLFPSLCGQLPAVHVLEAVLSRFLSWVWPCCFAGVLAVCSVLSSTFFFSYCFESIYFLAWFKACLLYTSDAADEVY